jgi:hypothetical protein
MTEDIVFEVREKVRVSKKKLLPRDKGFVWQKFFSSRALCLGTREKISEYYFVNLHDI